MDDGTELTIGEVARRAGVATSSIRYYESIGLLPEPDRLHGQRRYDSDVLGRLAFIDVAQSAGFKLGEIKQLVGGIDDGDAMARDGSARCRPASSTRSKRCSSALSAMKGWLEVAQELRLRDARGMRAVPAAG